VKGFLLSNLAFTGLPLALFVLFSITVFVFALLVGLILGLLAAVLFTVFMVGVALVIVLPTIFFTTGAATFIFLWGLGGYYFVKWFNEDSGSAPKGEAIGDKISSLTGGRLDFLMGGAREQEAMQAYGGGSKNDKGPTTNGSSASANGSAHESTNGSASHKIKKDGGQQPAKLDPQKHANDAKDHVGKATGSATGGATDKVTKTAGGATGKAGTAAGTAKGVVGGATGGLT